VNKSLGSVRQKNSILNEIKRGERDKGKRQMASSGMLRRVALVRNNVSEELSDSFIRVTRIGELGTTAVPSNRRKLRKNTNFVLTLYCICIDSVFIRSVRRLLVTANVVPSSPINVTLMKKALSSTGTSVLTRITA
jgi:hypothetical protein